MAKSNAPFKVVCINSNWRKKEFGVDWPCPVKGEECIVVDHTEAFGHTYYILGGRFHASSKFSSKYFRRVSSYPSLSAELAKEAMDQGVKVETDVVVKPIKEKV